MDTDFKAAGFWRRLAAHMIDGLIIGIPVWAMVIWYIQSHSVEEGVAFTSPLMQIGWALISALYYVLFLSSRWQATPGKRCMRVYIMDENTHQRLGAVRAAGRYAAFNAATLLMMAIALIMPLVSDGSAAASSMDTRAFMKIWVKGMKQEKLTAEDQKAFDDMLMPKFMPGLSDTEQQRYAQLRTKQIEQRQKLTPEEGEEFFGYIGRGMKGNKQMQVLQGLNSLAGIYVIALGITVMFANKKRGVHDMICHTLAVVGRTSA